MREVDTRAHVLSNGHYSVLLTPGGGGVCALDGCALTRWQPDPTIDQYGVFGYLRDLETGAYWSVGQAPVAADATGGLRASADHVALWSACHGIETSCTIAVARARNTESRKLCIRNHSDRARTIELTTYAEIALNTLAADAAHPAFSKLFVETAFDAGRKALIAWRRRRSPGDRQVWMAQQLIGAGALEYDTDRARFIGRCRSVRAPLALLSRDPLAATVGAVLDPVFVLRTKAVLVADSEMTLELVTCAAESRFALEQLMDAERDTSRAACAGVPALGLPPAWLEAIRFDLGTHEWRCEAPAPRPVLPSREDYGGFNEAGTEYVLPVGGDVLPTPQPWINVLANEDFGCLVSETGAGYTWAANSRENRLTAWSNDAVTDPPSELVRVYDLDSGESWSAFPAPAPAPAAEVRHGFGYSRFTQQSQGLALDTIVFVPRHDPLKCVHVSIRNTDQVRRFRLVSCAQLVLGTGAPDTRGHVETSYRDHAIFASNRQRGEFAERVTFAAALTDAPVSARAATGSRASFLRDPRALDGRFGKDLDACAALSLDITVAAGQTADCVFILGGAESEKAARACLERYPTVAAAQRAFEEVRAYWRDLLTRVQVTTPVPAFDLMLNGWLTYQNLACRMWARSAFHQSGGAFGFRDQLQDSSALLYYDANITRAQILLHAAHQFVEGDVLHWWHPPLSKGIRTRFSDDLLWLPYITLFYMERTGDWDILDENVRYLKAPQLTAGEDEIFVFPEASGTSGTLYQHCCKAVDRSLTKGAHGLPLIGVGDWNDGMNRVGREGRGESVWLGFFLFDILNDFIAVCEARQDRARVHSYREYMEQLAEALNDAGWDGAWYRRAYYDNGAPIGSAQSDECRIDALAQAWAVLSRAAPAERALQAITAMQRQLVCERDGIIRLLTPAFDKTPHDPGYIKGYIPGVRENGGQYTHAATWAVRAIAELGQRESAARLLEMLSPVTQTGNGNVVRYGGEPYVMAADVYGEPPHVGRAGWTWYTGSAGWYYRVLLESVLGFELDNNDVVRLRPCIPRDWPGFTLRYRFGSGTTYTFHVTQREKQSSTSEGSVEDGAIIIPIVHDGGAHDVQIACADDVVPRYESRLDSSTAPLLRTTSL